MGDEQALGIDELARAIRKFAADRDWDQFHSPRNLVLALVGEVGELAAEFQWVSDDAIDTFLTSPEKRSAVELEMADVLSYLLRLADILQVDLAGALRKKIALNENRYPVDKARGSSSKYTAYE